MSWALKYIMIIACIAGEIQQSESCSERAGWSYYTDGIQGTGTARNAQTQGNYTVVTHSRLMLLSMLIH